MFREIKPSALLLGILNGLSVINNNKFTRSFENNIYFESVKQNTPTCPILCYFYIDLPDSSNSYLTHITKNI